MNRSWGLWESWGEGSGFCIRGDRERKWGLDAGECYLAYLRIMLDDRRFFFFFLVYPRLVITHHSEIYGYRAVTVKIKPFSKLFARFIHPFRVDAAAPIDAGRSHWSQVASAHAAGRTGMIGPPEKVGCPEVATVSGAPDGARKRDLGFGSAAECGLDRGRQEQAPPVAEVCQSRDQRSRFFQHSRNTARKLMRCFSAARLAETSPPVGRETLKKTRRKED